MSPLLFSIATHPILVKMHELATCGEIVELALSSRKQFVGKHVPPDGRYRELADLRTGSDRFRPIKKDTYVNMPKIHIGINMT